MIKFLVVGQQLNIVTPIVVADTHNYLTAEAVFRGDAWNPCTKWAHFIMDGKDHPIPFHADSITADQRLNLTAGTWEVYIHGSEYDAEADEIVTRITTSKALLKVEPAETDSPFPDIEPEFGEVLAAEVEHALEIAQGVRQDAAAGTFDGATFTPLVTEDGVLSWTNDKELANPLPVNIKGASGEPGADFQILGYYSTLDDLTATVIDPYPGDAYGVGAEQPYDIYIYDAVGDRWVNNGPVQGAKGDPGKDATISVGTVNTVPFDQGASVTNVGTASAAKFNFDIPAGKTPVKGEDYWTENDIKEIAASISPGAIGAIPDPDVKSSGQYLKFESGAWKAATVASGVSMVNGATGEVETRLIFQNQTVQASAFTKQANPSDAEYPYIASIALSGVTAQMIPDVIFASTERKSGNYSPEADSYTGGIYIYAKTAPTASISIPVIFMSI